MGTTWIVPLILFLVVGFILWRPWKMNEAIPATIGALLVFLLGFINFADLNAVLHVVSGAGITIISTIIMSSVLDRAGFFRWAAIQIATKARGSGRRLFILTLLLSFCMTMFFNNDGSILITTPIILEVTRRLKFSKAQALPYLIGGCLVATSSSAPIGVSNLANLIALSIVGLNLNQYAALMFVPSVLGISVCGGLLYWVFRKNIPNHYSVGYLADRVFPPRPGQKLLPPQRKHHAAKHPPGAHSPTQLMNLKVEPQIDRPLFIVGLSIVICVRLGFFVGAFFNVPVEWIAITGAVAMLAFYMYRKPKDAWEIVLQAPWFILLFAFGMYTIVYGLHKQGFTYQLGRLVDSFSGHQLIGWILVTGLALTIMSCVMNNLPSVMVGTIMLTDLHLPPVTLKLSYLANVLGSDIGSLLLPMGTLASLLWFHIVSKKIKVTWLDYMKISFIVIPPSLVVSLVSLYLWAHIVLI